MNRFKIACTTHPNLRAKWFSRRRLVYAVHMDGWILYDNTGLKCLAARFARENLEDEKLLNSPVGTYIEKIDCSSDEQSTYESVLPTYTHIIQAVGFVRDPLPPVSRDRTILEDVVYDHKRGGFSGQRRSKARWPIRRRDCVSRACDRPGRQHRARCGNLEVHEVPQDRRSTVDE